MAVKLFDSDNVATAEKQQAEALFRKLVENSLAGIHIIQDGRYVYVNPKLAEIFGYTAEEVLALDSWLDVVAREDRDLVADHVRRRVSGESPSARYTFRGLRKDGTIIDVEVHGNKAELNSRPAVIGTVLDVTERKRAEEALLHSEARKAAILDTALDAIITIDHQGKVVEFNPAAEGMFGYGKADVLGREMAELIIPPSLRDSHRLGLSRYLCTGEGPVLGRRLELTAMRSNGTEFPAEVAIIRLPQDGPALFTGYIRDISERRRAEKALAEGAKLASLVGDIGVALTQGSSLREMLTLCTEALVRHLTAAFARVWTINESGDTLELQASAGMYTHLDGPHSRVPLGKFKIGLIAQERLPHLTNQVVGDPRVGDQEWAKCEGMVAFAGYPLLVAGRLVGVVALFARHELTDMTMRALAGVADQIALGIDRKRGENALKETEEKYRSIFENAVDGIFQTTPAGEFLAVNPAMARILGFASPEELMTQRFDIARQGYVDPRRREEFKRKIEAHGVVTSFEYEVYRKDGTKIWVSEDARGILDAGGRPRLYEGSLKDITEQKQLEEQFRQAQKMEAVGRLAGGVAHDFNNLLTVINGYSEVILGKLHAGDPLRDLVEMIKNSGERAASLTRQLLAFSRKQVLVPVALDLNALLTEMEKMLRRLIGEDIDLKVSGALGLWPIKADAGQIEQVVMNLVVNARDAMPQGGKLTIETRNVNLDETHVGNHSETRPGSYVLLAVSDTGSGMDVATKARIFEPFFSTKGEKGTGLGLATVFGIVKQSGGSIEVYTELGQGTTFKIYLPREREATPLRKSHHGAPTVPRGKETILVVDDDDGVRQLTRIILENHGYRVLEGRSGGEAILRSEQYQDPIHLLVTDVVMPNMSGRQLVERLTALRPDIQVLYLSGYTDDAVVAHGVLDADVSFLQKPFTTEGLARKVREVLDQNVFRFGS